jgi:pilus assembly protein CpaC
VSADGFNLGSESGGLSPLGPSLGVRSQAGQISIGYSGAEGAIQATLQALDETNMIRTLAEPTLTAVSGEMAHFHAGGEFGYQTIDIEDDDDGEERQRVRVAFKPFGVELAFTPVVLSGGRISMRLRTEVSEIAGTTFGIPFLNTREAETTVELPSGGAFVIAGLIQEQTRRAALGALFSSKEFRSEQTELIIVVTPYLVKPVLPKDLARPDDNLVLAGDAEAYFKNKLTKVYGSATHLPAGTSGGPVGFTFD